MNLVSVLGAYKAGLYAAAKAVYDRDTTYVCSGEPSQDVMAELVSIGATEIGQEAATLGTNRGREETLTCEVVLSVFRGGGDEQQPTADARVGQLLTLLEKQVHYTDTTLGGVVRECFLTAARLDSGPGSLGDNTRGRLAAITATFTAKARILNG
jgi:hypothetical protein